jgi:hypothetical protein
VILPMGVMGERRAHSRVIIVDAIQCKVFHVQYSYYY